MLLESADGPRPPGAGRQREGPWPRSAPSAVRRCGRADGHRRPVRPATVPPPPPWRLPRRIPSPRTGATSTAGSGWGCGSRPRGSGRRWAPRCSPRSSWPCGRSTRRAGSTASCSTVAIADEGSDPATAYQALTELLESDQVDVIVGPASSRIALGALDVLADARAVTCSPTSAAYDLGERPGRRLLRPHHRLRGAGGDGADEGDDRGGDDTLFPCSSRRTTTASPSPTRSSGSSAGSGQEVRLVPYDPTQEQFNGPVELALAEESRPSESWVPARWARVC